MGKLEDLEDRRLADIISKAMMMNNIQDSDVDALIEAVLEKYEGRNISELNVLDVMKIADASGIVGIGESGYDDSDFRSDVDSNIDLGELLFEIITADHTCSVITNNKGAIESTIPAFEGDEEAVSLTLDSIYNLASEYGELDEEEIDDFEFTVSDFPGLENGIGGNGDPYEEFLTSILVQLKSYL